MTREQAAQIISKAIVANGSSYVEETLARHIATALNALGLLTYAIDPHLSQPASATSNTQERNPTEEIAAAARIVSGNPLPIDWASTRTRD